VVEMCARIEETLSDKRDEGREIVDLQESRGHESSIQRREHWLDGAQTILEIFVHTGGLRSITGRGFEHVQVVAGGGNKKP
jgi:hypothetical protein